MNKFIQAGIGAASLALATSSLAAGGLSVSREVTVDRAPATVWKLVGDFNALDVWLPPVQRSTSTGVPTQPGALRVLALANNASVTEKLTAYSSARHTYSYAFIESPLPVKNYVATIELSAAADGKTRVKWHSTFDAHGVTDDQAREAIEGIYNAGLAKVATIFKQ